MITERKIFFSEIIYRIIIIFFIKIFFSRRAKGLKSINMNSQILLKILYDKNKRVNFNSFSLLFMQYILSEPRII